MGKRYTQAVKDELLGKIRNGRKVLDVAREHGINDMTVRTWSERDTEFWGSAILEVSRLKRENEARLRIVGQLTYEAEQQKKSTSENFTDRCLRREQFVVHQDRREWLKYSFHHEDHQGHEVWRGSFQKFPREPLKKSFGAAVARIWMPTAKMEGGKTGGIWLIF